MSVWLKISVLHTCDDPHWKIPSRYMDPSRVEGMFKKIDRLDKQYSGCADDLFNGVPTDYCVLCVSKEDSSEVVKEAYERKKNLSTYPDEVIERAYVMREHQDWENYMGDKTFYGVLNIDAASIPEEKREAENFIRKAYKDKERTPEVNLSYTVLKNSRLRDDYNWLLKHGEWVSMLHKSVGGGVNDAEIKAAMKIAEALAMEVKTGGAGLKIET